MDFSREVKHPKVVQLGLRFPRAVDTTVTFK